MLVKKLSWCAKFYNCIRIRAYRESHEEADSNTLREILLLHICFGFNGWELFLGSQLFPIVGQGVKMLVRHKSTQEYMTPFTSFNHALQNIQWYSENYDTEIASLMTCVKSRMSFSFLTTRSQVIFEKFLTAQMKVGRG